MSAPSAQVDQYLAAVASDTARATLSRLRAIIRDEAPEAEEVMSYGIPGYKLNGYLVGFAAFKNHCSFFPGTAIQGFESELEGYKTSKGTIQFRHDQPLPESLVRRIVQARLAQNRETLAAKKKP